MLVGYGEPGCAPYGVNGACGCCGHGERCGYMVVALLVASSGARRRCRRGFGGRWGFGGSSGRGGGRVRARVRVRVCARARQPAARCHTHAMVATTATMATTPADAAGLRSRTAAAAARGGVLACTRARQDATPRTDGRTAPARAYTRGAPRARHRRRRSGCPCASSCGGPASARWRRRWCWRWRAPAHQRRWSVGAVQRCADRARTAIVRAGCGAPMAGTGRLGAVRRRWRWSIVGVGPCRSVGRSSSSAVVARFGALLRTCTHTHSHTRTRTRTRACTSPPPAAPAARVPAAASVAAPAVRACAWNSAAGRRLRGEILLVACLPQPRRPHASYRDCPSSGSSSDRAGGPACQANAARGDTEYHGVGHWSAVSRQRARCHRGSPRRHRRYASRWTA